MIQCPGTRTRSRSLPHRRVSARRENETALTAGSRIINVQPAGAEPATVPDESIALLCATHVMLWVPRPLTGIRALDAAKDSGWPSTVQSIELMPLGPA